ncbi:MAG: UDP-2,3-diacylglucosamine diphosphatase LpxI [Planctomycetia bacterium]|nr:UDP-2,3-diacylglucosamine diphosphatase LpxI [Planctomycetia bacterium]
MTHASASSIMPSKRIGLFAGWGRYPVVVAEALVAQGYEVYCLGVKEHADAAALRPFCKHFQWNGVARFGAAIRYFQKHGIVQATMAGKIHKTRLYRPLVWLHYVPDLRTIRMFYNNFIRTQVDRRDDTLLGTIVKEFAGVGIDFAPATDFAPELLVKFGQLSRRPPTALERKDVEFGWQLAKEMGRLDIGQSVVVKGRNALAIEAIEGTDACILRAGELCSAGKFTVVKVAKPQQDMRFDVPTIGIGTLEQMVRAGASCLAIEAGKTIVIDQEAVCRFADRNGLAIIALEAAAQALTTGEAA